MARSLSYIDDVATAPFKILNIGSGHLIELMRFKELLELNLGLEAKKQFLPMQAGDVGSLALS